MASERFFSRVKQDIFRPFTGRHRGIAFEVTVELYDRLLGANADYDLTLNRERLTDIIGTATGAAAPEGTPAESALAETRSAQIITLDGRSAAARPNMTACARSLPRCRCRH